MLTKQFPKGAVCIESDPNPMKILVPTDFSEISEYGLQAARDIALRTEAEIFLVNYIEPAVENDFSASGDVSTLANIEAEAFIIELTKRNSQRIHDLAQKYQRDGTTIKPVIEVDYFEDAMDQFIKEKGIDLVVMGTSGERSYDELVFGNHTERIIRVSLAPTLSVRDYARKFEPKSIVLALDLVNEGQAGLAYINKFAGYFDAEVHLLHVTKNKNAEAEALKKLEEKARQAGFNRYTVNVVISKDKKNEIETFAADKRADMIGVFTRGRPAVASLFFGSLTQELVKDADISTPVLSIKVGKK